jgi:hypothetical protein
MITDHSSPQPLRSFAGSIDRAPIHYDNLGGNSHVVEHRFKLRKHEFHIFTLVQGWNQNGKVSLHSLRTPSNEHKFVSGDQLAT